MGDAEVGHGAFVGDTIEGYEKTSYKALGTAKITAVERQHDPSLKAVIKNAYVGVAGGYQSEDLVYKITLDKPWALKWAIISLRWIL